MSERRFDPRVLPPSVADARGVAFAATLGAAMAERDFSLLLFERIDGAPPEALPHLVRAFGMQHFVAPDMTDAVIRRLLKASFDLHAEIGYIRGVRRGLALLGISVDSWQQWFEAQPPGLPGTHLATLSIGEEVFAGEGRAITLRLQRSIAQMVTRMQRFSQHVGLRLSGPASEAPVFVGAVVRQRITIRPSSVPSMKLAAATPVFVGAVVRSRIRIVPRAA